MIAIIIFHAHERMKYFSFQQLTFSAHRHTPVCRMNQSASHIPQFVRCTTLHSAARSLAGWQSAEKILYMCMRMRESSSIGSHREPSTGYDCRCFAYFEPSTRDRSRVASKYSNVHVDVIAVLKKVEMTSFASCPMM